MRICLATSLYPPDPGGPATYAKVVEEGLPKHGITVQVTKFGDFRHLPKILRHAAFLWAIMRTARSADAILVQDTTSTGAPAAIAAWLRRKPLVVRVPGDLAWEQSRQRFGVTMTLDEFQSNRGPWRARALHAVQRWVVGRARKVIVPSRYFQKIVNGWGVPDASITVIYHGIELPTPVLPAHRPTGRLIVSAGRFVPWKGFGMLISLLPELPEWTLVLIGNGPEAESLKRLTQTTGVSDRVVFAGGLPREEVVGWCAVGDAFVLNTSFESFSFQVAEAMAAGIPVITTNIGSLPELITSSEEGVLLPPNDRAAFKAAILEVAEKPEIWSERTLAAKKKMETFSVNSMLLRTADTLKSVI